MSDIVKLEDVENRVLDIRGKKSWTVIWLNSMEWKLSASTKL